MTTDAPFDWDAYVTGTHVTANYPGFAETWDDYPLDDGVSTGDPHDLTAAVEYVALGTAGEAGELANQAKKILRDDGGLITPERRDHLIAEAGDLLWYVARLGHHLGVPLEEIARRNLAKLRGRAERGTIHGDGDDR